MPLIVTNRHTERDLAHWRVCEQEDVLQAARLGSRLAAMENRAREELRSFIDRVGTGYLSVSWGKDSVVCAWLLASIGVRYPAVWVRVDGWENPDCELVRDAFLDRWKLDGYEEISVEVGSNRGGGTLVNGFAEATRRHGDAYVSGVRADESKVRRVSIFSRGLSTKRVCRPIGHWSTADVFAFSALRGLPLHPAYGYTMGGIYDRMHLRTASLGGTRGQEHGRAEWERVYYGVDFVGSRRSRGRLPHRGGAGSGNGGPP